MTLTNLFGADMRTRQITYGKHDYIRCFYYNDEDTPSVNVPEGVAEYCRLRLKIRAMLSEAIQAVKEATTEKEELRAKGRREAYTEALMELDERAPHHWFEVGATSNAG